MSNLGNKEIMARNIRYYLDKNKLTQTDLCKTLKFKAATVSDWLHAKSYPRIDKIEMMSNYFGINKSDLVEDNSIRSDNVKSINLSNAKRIPILGKIPAGTPLEAVEDIRGYVDISAANAESYCALQVVGNSMYPKYMEGDVVIFRKADDCESGQDCIVYVNGYDATLKKVIKKQDCLVLQPLNPQYEPMVYDYNSEDSPVSILGIVVEIRRTV